MNLHCEWSIISTLSFLHIVHDDLPRVFIEPIGFTTFFPKYIILRYCCGRGFCVNLLAKWSEKESELLSWMKFWATSRNFCSALFCVYFEYLKCRNHHTIYMWLCRQHIIRDIHLSMHTNHLLLYLRCSWNIYRQSI